MIGLEDDTCDETVSVLKFLKEGETLELEDLKPRCQARLSAYKIPNRLLVVENLPRNAMCKVTKPAVRELF